MNQVPDSDRLYILMCSIHGLVRGNKMELGRDADTGGQVKYVVELARALSRHREIASIDLITRSIHDPTVDASYASPIEKLSDRARIIRLECGPRRYIAKEDLWPYLQEFKNNILAYLESLGRLPDILHAHYADAGLVCAELSEELGIPLVFTGHSLGRMKKARLLKTGMDAEMLDKRYRMHRRIEAEESALRRAELVITSTKQEAEEQYAAYRNHRPRKVRTIAPGVNLSRFKPPAPGDPPPRCAGDVDRFLQHPVRPMILAMARPDERKNFHTLIRAYGQDPELTEMANLVLVIGTRKGILHMKGHEKEVMQKVLMLIDEYDLYGRVSYPKQHVSSDVPEIYRMAVLSGGVFINPAVIEPFGLTLLEAAASGLPLVATRDGGPREIIGKCLNGFLIDPLDPFDIAKALKRVLNSSTLWFELSANGLAGVQDYYSWSIHAGTYLRRLEDLLTDWKIHIDARTGPNARPITRKGLR